MNQAIRFFLEFLYQYVSFYPCVLLCCLSFTDTHKQSVRKIVLVFAFICIPVSAIPAALYVYFEIGGTAPIVSLVFMLVSFFCCRLTIREGLDKLLFTFFLVTHMVCMVTDIECAVLSLTADGALWGDSGSFPDLCSLALLRLTAYFIVWRLINRFITPRLRHIKSEYLKGLWVLPVIFTAVSAYRVSTHLHKGTYELIFPALTLFFALLSFVLYNLILKLLDSTMARVKLEEKTKKNDIVNKTKKKFLQDIRHEMKNPLTVIATGIDFADRTIKSEAGSLTEVRDALDTIRAETQRLGRMIDSMANLSTLDDPGKNRQRTDFAALLRQNAEKFRYTLERQGNVLTIKLVPAMPDVFIETDRMAQVVSNLLTNAAEHTKNGKITVTADYDDEYITVRISDTGEGIAPDLLPKVFERGVSGRGSTGYGLYICKTVVEAHGGTMEISSEQGRGCAVTFTVPVYGGQEAGHGI